MKHRLILDYTIPMGDLAPYRDALRAGKALASQCARCGRVAFPARLRCGACGGSAMNWTPLDGTAQIQFRTDGSSGSFALVKFAGADTLSTVGLINPQRKTTEGRLSPPEGDRPGLWLSLDGSTQGEDDE